MTQITESISNRFMIAVLAIVLFKVILVQSQVEQRDARNQELRSTAPAHFIIR